MVYLDGKTDVKWRTLVGVVGESPILSVNLGGTKISGWALLGRRVSIIRTVGCQISYFDSKVLGLHRTCLYTWRCVDMPKANERYTQSKWKFNLITRPPTGRFLQIHNSLLPSTPSYMHKNQLESSHMNVAE